MRSCSSMNSCPWEASRHCCMILGMAVATILFAALGFMSPASRGTLITGPDNLDNLRKLADQFQKQAPGAGATAEEDNDDVPELVEGQTFQVAATETPVSAAETPVSAAKTPAATATETLAAAATETPVAAATETTAA